MRVVLRIPYDLIGKKNVNLPDKISMPTWVVLSFD